MTKDFLTKAQAESFFEMLQAKDMEIVHMALDMILNADVYLPYRYNDQGPHRLKAALEAVTPDIKGNGREWIDNKWINVPYTAKSKELQKRLNRVRAKQTLPWDWRLIE